MCNSNSIENLYSLVNRNIENSSISFRVPINLGDTIVFTIFLNQFRKTYPDIFIVVDGHRTFSQDKFTLNDFSTLLIGNPNIDLLILKPEDFLKLKGNPLVKYHYHIDILMIQQCFLGAWKDGSHEADIFCDIIGISRPVKLEPKIFLSKTEIEEGKYIIDGLLQKESKDIVLIQPEAVNPLKQWPKKYWDSLVDNIKDKYEVLQIGTNPDWQLKGSISLIGKSYSLRQIAAIATHLKKFIGTDSGIHHLCRAVGSNCIVIAPSIYPKSLWSYPEDIVLIRSEEEFECAYCEQNRLGMAVWGLSNIPEDMNHGKYCCSRPKCIESISVEEVIESIKKAF